MLILAGLFIKRIEQRNNKMKLPKIVSYGQYKSGNYGAHSLRVDIGSLSVYFSYETVVAFSDEKDGKGGQLVVRKNDWSTTTGKHLNWIDGGNKSARIDGEKFEQALHEKLVAYGLEDGEKQA